MDDPTRWCENDTGIETRLPGLRIPSRSPSFLSILYFLAAGGVTPFRRRYIAVSA
jgi:hypothetical protein